MTVRDKMGEENREVRGTAMRNGERKNDPYPPTMGELARLILEAQVAGEPIVLSINGRGALPVTDAGSIDELHALVDHLESIEVLRGRLAATAANDSGHDLAEICQELRASHGLPR